MPATASAHGTVEGMQGFYAGVLHPLTIPAHLMTLVAIGLLICQRPANQVRFCLPPFAAGLISGLVTTLFLGTFFVETAIVILALATGLVVAIVPTAHKWLAAGLSVAGGLLIGLDSNSEQNNLRDNLIVAAGMTLSSLFLASYPVVIENAVKAEWKGIAIRVMGSWIAAASAMVAALSILS